MIVYQTDENGFFVHQTVADPDPLDVGNWLIPAGCVVEPPPRLSDGQRAQYASGVWHVVDPEPEPEVVEPPAPDKDQQKANRQAAYMMEADPIFFMVQRGEATMDEWTAKIAEIKARFPYPEP